MSSRSPDFSIIIPTYNRPAQLGHCLEALARLEYPRDRFEVIVVDDGSVVSIGEVTASFRPRLDLSVLAVPNGGPAAARNRGAAQAGGAYLAFTDDDCTPTNGWLRALDSRATVAPGAMLGGRTVNALPDNLCSALSHLVVEVAYACANADPSNARFFAANNLVVPANGFRQLGGFDPMFTTAEDRDLCARWRRHGGRLVYAPEAVVCHAHALTLTGLWRQHFAYGRGAFRLHRRHGRGWRFDIDRRFYRALVRGPFLGQRGPRAARLAVLLAVQQTANAAGFLAEMLTRHS
jgi:GT2 family glycosyltransferase